MATEIAKAYVQIIPTTKGITEALKTELGSPVEKAGKESGTKFGAGLLKNAGTAISAGAAALGAAAAGAFTAVVNAANQTAQLGDSIDKSSQKLGVSAKFYQEWEAVLQHSGTSMDAMGATFKTLAKSSQSASKDQVEAFEKLGLSLQDVSKMSSEDLFQSVISGLQGMEESTERTALATTLLGRGAMELGPLLNTSAADTQAMISKVNELGGVMSNDAVKAAAAYQDSLQDMQTAFSGLKNNLSAEFLPAMAGIMDGLSGLITGEDGAASRFADGVSLMMSTLSGTIEQALPAATEAMTNVLNAVLDVLPEMVGPLTSAVMSFVVESLPVLIDAGFQLFTALIGAMPQIIETIVAALPELIESVTTTLSNNIPLLVVAGVQLFTSLITAMPEIVSTVVMAVPEIIAGIVTGFVERWPEIKQAGIDLFTAAKDGLFANLTLLSSFGSKVLEKLKSAMSKITDDVKEIGGNIVSGIWNGISGKWTDFYNNVSGFFSGIVGSVKKTLGIASPSKVFSSIGRFCAEGLNVGFESEIEDVQRNVQRGVAGIIGDIGAANMQITANVTPASADNGLSHVINRLADAVNGRDQQIHVYLDSREIRAGQDRLARAIG